jgi:ABC-type multidrug transport system fused ATPase/permease subunit
MRAEVTSNVPVSRRAVLAEAAELVGSERKLLLRVGALVLINRGAALGPATASKIVIDRVIGSHRSDLLAPVALALIAAIAVEAASGFALYRAVGLASQRAVTRLRRKLQAHVLGLPVGFFDGSLSGGLLSRLVSDPDAVRDLLGPGLVQLASAVLTAVLAVALLLALDWALTAAVVAVLTVSLVALLIGLSRLYGAFNVTGELTAELTGRLAEVLGGIGVVKTFRAERREAYGLARESHRLLRAFVVVFAGAGGVLAMSAAATGLVNAMVLVLGGRAVLTGRLTLGDLVLYLFLVGLLTAPLLQIAANVSELGRAGAALGRFAQLRMVATEGDLDRGLDSSITATHGAVTFERVSYAYRSGYFALRDVSFEAQAGTMVAIVGRNGSGKTTIMRLLGGLIRPTDGRILVDTQDLGPVSLRAWRAHVSAVWQEPFLFDGTIADNIAYGRPDATPADIQRVARLAHCDDVVDRLPDGYATRVGERGVQLSGGQRQRVALARALLADARILLLDEATAHVDPESELLIGDALRALRAGRTTFVIAHRLATVRDSDQVLVLEGGALMERGTHDELVARRGVYWRLAAGHLLREQALAEEIA